MRVYWIASYLDDGIGGCYGYRHYKGIARSNQVYYPALSGLLPDSFLAVCKDENVPYLPVPLSPQIMTRGYENPTFQVVAGRFIPDRLKKMLFAICCCFIA
jgi:hypothetical protein